MNVFGTVGNMLLSLIFSCRLINLYLSGFNYIIKIKGDVLGVEIRRNALIR